MTATPRKSSRFALLALVLAAAPSTLGAQSPACAPPAPPAREWVRLCADGNGVAALRRVVDLPTGAMRVGDALRVIAERGGVSITLDASLAPLQQQFVMPGGRGTVAESMRRIIEDRPIEIDVGAEGALIVLASGSGDASRASAAPDAAVTDSLRRIARLSRVVVTATRDAERQFREQPVSGAMSFGARELAAAPGFFGNDVLRTARLLPGFSARNDFSTAFNVRGGESDQTLVMLDGIPIYNPSHFGGLLSSFIEPAVGRLDIFNGVFPTRYDGRLSALLDVRSAEEPRAGVHGVADVNLLSSTASIGGTSRSSNTSWLLAGRRTYADIASRLVRFNIPYHFQDANLHVTHRLAGGSRLELTAYQGADVVDTTITPDTVDVSSGNVAVGAAWSDVRPRGSGPFGFIRGDSVGLLQRASVTSFAADVDAGRADVDVRSHVRDVRVSGALTSYAAGGSQSLGYELARLHTDYALDLPDEDFRRLVRNFTPSGHSSSALESASAWYEGLWKLSPSLMIQGGGRADFVRGLESPLLSPRVSAKLLLSPGLAVTAAVGRHSQWMHSVLREEIPIRMLDFWVASDSAAPPARAWVFSLGVERALGPLRHLRVEGYHKQLSGIVARNTLEDTLIAGDELGIERGRSSGVDVLLRQSEHNGFSGWLSYSFGISRRTGADGVEYAPVQDRRHELNVVASWRTRRYQLGTRFALASGTPYTMVLGEYAQQRYDPVSDEWGRGGDSQVILGPRNAERFPLSHRLDVSLTRTGLNGTARTMPYLSIANVYGAFNPAVYLFNYGGFPPERTGASNFRFMPTFGIKHVF